MLVAKQLPEGGEHLLFQLVCAVTTAVQVQARREDSHRAQRAAALASHAPMDLQRLLQEAVSAVKITLSQQGRGHLPPVREHLDRGEGERLRARRGGCVKLVVKQADRP